MEDWGFTRIHPSPSWPRRLLREKYPGRFSDSRIFLLLAPSHPELVEGQWFIASFVPDYSGGSVPDFLRLNGDHGVPFTQISLFFKISPIKLRNSLSSFF